MTCPTLPYYLDRHLLLPHTPTCPGLDLPQLPSPVITRFPQCQLVGWTMPFPQPDLPRITQFQVLPTTHIYLPLDILVPDPLLVW